MVFFNHATRQMTTKIVYYGPGLCGKTTNLNTIYGSTSQKARGEMVSLNTETDRTLFFDLLPLDVGMVGGFKTKLQLYTVPGQVFYNSTRKLVLKGVDGIVFVVDSQTAMVDACRESYLNLEENLRELGLVLGEIPTVFQWNKRDLKNVVSIDQLESTFNPRGLPSFQSVASDGTGVFETLRGITKLALSHIKAHVLEEGAATQVPAPVRPAPAALTLSDLPSVSDLLDLEEPAPAAPPAEPLADDDDDIGFLIEAPILPEPPEPVSEELGFLMEADPTPSQAFMEEFNPPAPEPVIEHVPEPEHTPEPEPTQESEPVHEPPPAPLPVAPRPKTGPRMDPLAGLASSLHQEVRKPVLKPRGHEASDAINSLLGELTLAGRSGAPSVLRLEVPAELDGELEVVVQLRHRGVVVSEGQIHRPAPVKGSTAKLSVEMKRN